MYSVNLLQALALSLLPLDAEDFYQALGLKLCYINDTRGSAKEALGSSISSIAPVSLVKAEAN